MESLEVSFDAFNFACIKSHLRAQRADTMLSGCSFAILQPPSQTNLHSSAWRPSGVATKNSACPPCHPRRALPRASASKSWTTYLA